MDRRRFLLTLSSTALVGGSLGGNAIAPAAGETSSADVDAILNDPQAPTAGNPNGNVTIVAFLDYNCPFCKRTAPDLARFVKADGEIRLVYKDWPILAPTSVYGARLALSAKYQSKYDEAHAALMGLHGPKASETGMMGAVEAAGVDKTQLAADLNAHEEAIMILLRRNAAQANALGLKGTPVYLIGPYLVEAALDYDGFADVVSKFRGQISK